MKSDTGDTREMGVASPYCPESSCQICGGDFERAGAASRLLKEQLKKIGVAPDVLRRAMIAAYEAEMNVVIHARRGIMKAVLDDKQARVEIIDEGPGIADPDLALTEGYSTAGSQALRLGFGAGMGLSNIRKSVDRFTIESTVGKGTRLCFTIYLKAQTSGADRPDSLHIGNLGTPHVSMFSGKRSRLRGTAGPPP